MKSQEFKSEQVTLDRSLAEDLWSRRNESNRKHGRDRIISMTNDMLGGRWQFNGVGIVTDENDRLIDGHGRIQAFLSAARTQPSLTIPILLVRGVCRDKALHTIDVGQARTSANILQLAGYPVAKHDSILKAMLSPSDGCRLARSRITEAYERYQPAVDFAYEHIAKGRRHRCVGRVVVSGTIARAYWHYAGDQLARLARFCDVLITGNANFDEPLEKWPLLLRDRLIESSDKLTKSELHLRIESCISAYMNNQACEGRWPKLPTESLYPVPDVECFLGQ